MVDEIPEAASSSVGRLAVCHEDHSERDVDHSERDVQRVSKRFKLTLPLPLSEAQVGHETLPFIRMTDWARFILQHNLWYRLCGLTESDPERCCKIWSAFWERYRCINPQHEIFQDPSRDLSRTCGLLLHGDEGRSLRKSALMVIATHSILGFGLSTSKPKQKSKYLAQKLNYEQPTWTTRFLLSVLPKQYYNDENEGEWDSDPFQDLMKSISDDLRTLFDHGIQTAEGTFSFCIVNVMGDWPFIQKCGDLSRSYLNISKAASSKAPAKGICHLCTADMAGVVWENFEAEPPTWLATVNTLSAVGESSVLVLPKNDDFPESMFAFDLFHAWHIGAGKTFLASCLSLLIQSTVYEGSIDLRCETLSGDYRNWSNETGTRCQLRKITKAKLGGLSSTTFPVGAWSKGSTTTVLMKFFLHMCAKHQEHINHDLLLQLAQRCAMNMDDFLRGVYSYELWIASKKAKPIIAAGLTFLKLHAVAVRVAHSRKKLLFQLMPNYHRIHHMLWDMHTQCLNHKVVMNPLYAATQSDEDFIGRPSRVSRRVSPRLTVQRTLQRSLLATYAAYVEVGALIRDAA